MKHKKGVACRRDERETARKESGALLVAVHNVIVSWDQVENLADIVLSDARFRSLTPRAFCSHRMISRSRTLRCLIKFTNWRSKKVWGVISRLSLLVAPQPAVNV